jgi:hypothetical protein
MAGVSAPTLADSTISSWEDVSGTASMLSIYQTNIGRKNEGDCSTEEEVIPKSAT